MLAWGGLRGALTVALATSLLGYAILTWVPFPALKQIACFAIAGITTAFASVLWLLPALLTRAPKRRRIRIATWSRARSASPTRMRASRRR